MADTEASNVVTSDNAATFYAERLGLADQVELTEAVETAEPAQNEEQSEPEAKEDAKKQEPEKAKEKLNKRFDKVSKRAQEAEAKAAELERQLQELKAGNVQQQEPEKAQVTDKPQAHQFNDAFEYAEALATWSAENALKNRDKQDADRRAGDERQKVLTSWKAKLDATKAEIPDYEDMVASSDVIVSDQIRDAILESDLGPRILYHLAEHTDIAEKLNSMSPSSAMREIGKMEARFEKAAEPQTKRIEPVTRSNAPKPITPIGSSRTSTDVPMTSDGKWEGSYSAWKEARKAGRIR